MLKGNIAEYIKKRGSISTETTLVGSINNIIKLIGSVSEFVLSLTTRAIVRIRLIVGSKIIIVRVVKDNLIKSKIILAIKSKVLKLSKANINNKVQIYARAMSYKIMSPTIGLDIIIGTSSNLSSIKNLTLGDIKTFTLRNIRFTMGVIANIVRVFGSTPLIFKTEINASAVVIRRRFLGDIKEYTLGEIKEFTLKELSEYEV